MKITDKKYMQTAINLAKKGIGKVEPNPAVGCVIVKNGKIIGKGYHKKFGSHHAEINALKDCKKQGNSPTGATVYVTLEPCSHFGKTPPCASALVKAKIKKIIVATKDPSEKVCGKGFAILKKAGIEVQTGLCSQQARQLNPAFFKLAQTALPFTIIKWAQSKDGFLSRNDGKKWLTNELSRKDVHKIRRRCQGILVGINTVIDDDPMLNARPKGNTALVRFVLDSNLKIPLTSKLVKTAGKIPLCIFTTSKAAKNIEKVNALKAANVQIVPVRKYNGQISLKAVLREIGRMGIALLLVEGGKTVITSFLNRALADEIIVYVSGDELGSKGRIKISAKMRSALKKLQSTGRIQQFKKDTKFYL